MKNSVIGLMLGVSLCVGLSVDAMKKQTEDRALFEDLKLQSALGNANKAKQLIFDKQYCMI